MNSLEFLGYVLIVSQTASLYAFPILLSATAIVVLRRGRLKPVGIGRVAFSGLLFVVAISPFAHYGYLRFLETRGIAEVQLRLSELQPYQVGPTRRPDAVVVKGEEGVAMALVGLGVFRSAYLESRQNDWRVLTLASRDGCPVGPETLHGRGRSDLQPDNCVERSPAVGPPADGRYLVLKVDSSPTRWRRTPGVEMPPKSGRGIELRWSPEKGYGQIDYWQMPYFSVLAFPPTIAGRSFRRVSYTPGGDVVSTAVEFVARAIGRFDIIRAESPFRPANDNFRPRL